MITASNAVQLKALAAILNNPLSLFYLKERYPASSYNQGTTFTKDMLNDLPVPSLSTKQMEAVAEAVDKVIAVRTRDATMPESEAERALNAMIYRLYDLTDAELRLLKAT